MGAFQELEGLFIDKLQSIKTLLSMTALEAKLTRLSLLPFMMTGCMMFVVLLVLWMALMGIWGCIVWEMLHRLLWVFFSIFMLNVVLLLILRYCLMFHLRHMSFEKTRQYAKSITVLNEKPHDTQ